MTIAHTMTVITLHPRPSLTPEPLATFEAPVRESLLELMLGGSRSAELPPLAELLGGLLSMADGSRRKLLFPLAGQPAELALLRRGSNVLVSHYLTDAAPEVLVLDRRVPLRALLDATALALEEEIAREADGRARDLARRLVVRASSERIAPIDDAGVSAARRSGGVIDDPGDGEPLAFGFDAAIFPPSEPARDAISHADVHAILFGGALWAWVRGRRVPLARGSIFLVVQRMVAAARALLEAAEHDRAMHVRLRSGAFVIAVRRERGGEVALTLGAEDDGTLTVPALDVASAALPILRLATDLVRALVSVDRTQSRNLRVVSLREEVRRLRRQVRSRARTENVFAEDPERLRASLVLEPPELSADSEAQRGPGQLRFTERWSLPIDGLDAASTFFCGDRLLVATSRRLIAIERNQGQVLWEREGGAGLSFLAGSALVRLLADGSLELRDLDQGECLLRAKAVPRLGGAPMGLFVGGGAVPPAAVIAEGRDRLAAIDLRTGEPRWRFSGRGASELRMQRSGRLLLVAGGDGTLHAIDAVTGEVAWRVGSLGRLCTPAIVAGDVAIAVSGEIGRGSAAMSGLDLYSGRERFRVPMGGPIMGAPVAFGGLVVVPISQGRRGALAAFDASSGLERWVASDPGLGSGAGALALDRVLVINSPRGNVTAVDDEGSTRWARHVAHPVRDDVPRRLEPILRGGALFVPSASVHVLRTRDGTSIGTPLPSDLVPDVMHVDERGWVYLGEESGHLSALAPGAHLSLVRT